MGLVSAILVMVLVLSVLEMEGVVVVMLIGRSSTVADCSEMKADVGRGGSCGIWTILLQPVCTRIAECFMTCAWRMASPPAVSGLYLQSVNEDVAKSLLLWMNRKGEQMKNSETI